MNKIEVEIPKVINGENTPEIVKAIEEEIRKQDLSPNETVKVNVPEGTRVHF